MNTDDRGMNLAEKVRRKRQWSTHRAIRESGPGFTSTTYDPPLPMVGEGDSITVHDDGRSEYVEVEVTRVPLPDVDWEALAGQSLANLQRLKHELERFRREMPADAVREYDRRHHGA